MNIVNILVWVASFLFYCSIVVPSFYRWKYRTKRYGTLGFIILNLFYLFLMGWITYSTFMSDPEPMSVWWITFAVFLCFYGYVLLKREIYSIKLLKLKAVFNQAYRNDARN
jgi:hypothetical protein